MFTIQNGYGPWIAKEARAFSRGRFYGEQWTLEAAGFKHFLRVSWIEDTGELYAASPRQDIFAEFGKFPTGNEVTFAMRDWKELYPHLDQLIARLMKDATEKSPKPPASPLSLGPLGLSRNYEKTSPHRGAEENKGKAQKPEE